MLVSWGSENHLALNTEAKELVVDFPGNDTTHMPLLVIRGVSLDKMYKSMFLSTFIEVDLSWT